MVERFAAFVRFFRTSLFVAAALLLVGCGLSLRQPLGPKSATLLPAGDEPLVDLRSRPFGDGQLHRVPTRWDFYWRRLLLSEDFRRARPPASDARMIGMHPWTEGTGKLAFPANGYATYRMLLALPPGQEYGVQLQQQLLSYRLYVDGRLLAEAGRVGTDRATAEPDRSHRDFVFRPAAGRTEFVLHVSNFELFRGGLRGQMVIGAAPDLARYIFRNRAFDIALFGLFIAVALYHVAFFFVQPSNKSFLFFAVLCMTFAIRIPFMSEKVSHLAGLGVPWDWQLRITGTMNILSPSLVMAFLRSVYPDAVAPRTVWAYTGISALFLCAHLLGIRALAPAMFLLYLLVLLPMLVHATYIVVRLSLRGRRSALLMAIGLFVVLLFGFYAMYRNWRALDAAQYALVGFAAFAMFQSIALGRVYSDTVRGREVLVERLERSRAALAAQRRDLEINLHDSLGGQLTDLKIITERSLERLNGGAAADAVADLRAIRSRIDETNVMFRGQLLFMEDMELASKDPLTGLHMMLLRRYSDAGREILFEASEAAAPAFEAAMSDDGWRLDLLQLAREICTNDLKYGCGESQWQVDLEAVGGGGAQLVMRQSNVAAGSGAGAPEGSTAVRSKQRAQKMGGELWTERAGDRFCLTARFPVKRSADLPS